VVVGVSTNINVQSEGFCNAALDRCPVLRGFLQDNPGLSKVLNVAQLDKTIAETHHNRGCITAEMNRPKKALEHQLIFNKMLLEELEEKPAPDMRLSMSFNELGVAYMINDGKFDETVSRLEDTNFFQNGQKAKNVSDALLKKWRDCMTLGGTKSRFHL
jgi:hypothetical protein